MSTITTTSTKGNWKRRDGDTLVVGLVDTGGTKLGTCDESMSATVGAMVVGVGASARARAASTTASERKVGHRLRAICSRSCRLAIPIIRLDTLVARPWDCT